RERARHEQHDEPEIIFQIPKQYAQMPLPGVGRGIGELVLRLQHGPSLRCLPYGDAILTSISPENCSRARMPRACPSHITRIRSESSINSSISELATITVTPSRAAASIWR